MKKDQEADSNQMRTKHEDELKALEGVAAMEVEGLKRSGELRKKKTKQDFDNGMERLLRIGAIDRTWFETVWERRIEMVEEHGRMMICAFEAGREPSGLTEEQARTIMPLPVKVEGVQPEQQQDKSLPGTPVELEAISIPRKPIPTRINSRERRETSSSSYVTAQSQPATAFDFQLSKNPWAWAMMPQEGAAQGQDEGTVEKISIPPQPAPSTNSIPTATKLARHLTPPSPIMDSVQVDDGAPEVVEMPMPQNGNAYLSMKNGECSRPIYDVPLPPPTPPESPHIPGGFPGQPPFRDHLNPPPHSAASEGQWVPQWMRVPSRLSSGGNSLETTVTYTPPSEAGSEAPSVKPRKSKSPMSNTRGNIADVSDDRNKSPPESFNNNKWFDSPGSLDCSMPSISLKKSRWPFRKKTYTEDEVKERMRRSVGDAFAA